MAGVDPIEAQRQPLPVLQEPLDRGVLVGGERNVPLNRETDHVGVPDAPTSCSRGCPPLCMEFRLGRHHSARRGRDHGAARDMQSKLCQAIRAIRDSNGTKLRQTGRRTRARIPSWQSAPAAASLLRGSRRTRLTAQRHRSIVHPADHHRTPTNTDCKSVGRGLEPRAGRVRSYF